METARLLWSRIPKSEDGELDGVSLFSSSNGNSVVSLDYEVIENQAYREEQVYDVDLHNKDNKIVDDASTVQILNIHEVKREVEIHIYVDPVDPDPNVAPLQMKMPKYYTDKPNARIKYFLEKGGKDSDNKVILIVGEEGLDLAKDSDGKDSDNKGASATVGIGRDDKSYGVDFNASAGSCSEGVDAGLSSDEDGLETSYSSDKGDEDESDMNGKKQKRKIVDPTGFKWKTFNVSVSAEPFQLSCLLKLISITCAGLGYSWYSTLQNFDWKGKEGPLGPTKYHQSLRGGHQDRMFSRNGDVECPLLNGLLVQDRMPG
ncbi:hypothetical protein POTOM_031908 [Populus tomentosa]|uniref:Uncharacterized protein n=1 Tax=Populus tomentosa TaxID=118781 RepID=A0A8X8CS15_POPTO|nr:hypothetical protein POTOM_031908 [Populus tomentosa]